jgi:hypothetical protein
MRIWICLIVTALAAWGMTKPAFAQLPFSNTQQTPTVSPYLNLLGSHSANGLPAYQTLVQPILQQQEQAAQQQGQITKLQKQQSALANGAGLTNPARGASTAIRGTGHVTAFMDYSHYYPHFQGHPSQ